MWTMIALGLGIGAGSSAALAHQPAPEAQVGAVIACLDIADRDARLACFDSSAAGLRTGLRSGTIAVEDPRTRPAREPGLTYPLVATVVGSGGAGFNRWRAELDNGQIWQTTDASGASMPPRTGSQVRIEQNAIGSHWMRMPSGRRARVRLVR